MRKVAKETQTIYGQRKTEAVRECFQLMMAMAMVVMLSKIISISAAIIHWLVKKRKLQAALRIALAVKSQKIVLKSSIFC